MVVSPIVKTAEDFGLSIEIGIGAEALRTRSDPVAWV